MRRVVGESKVVPKLHNSTRTSTTRGQENNQSRVEECHDKDWGIRWRMDEKLRNVALIFCGMGLSQLR